MHSTPFTRLLLACFMALFMFTPPSASSSRSVAATYPGSRNGRLSFGSTINGNTDIFSVRPNGRGLRRLTTDPSFDACAAWAPDGTLIAFCSDRSGAFEIWAMRPNGKHQRQVTHLGGRVLFPDISPDGITIAFGGTLPGGTDGNIYVTKLDGSGLVPLTSAPGLDRYPAWSPDGTRIVFISARTGTDQVWLMNADGSDQRQLTVDASVKGQLPDWKPDGTEIAYASGSAIFVMNADGSNQRQLTHPSSSASDFGSAWSPDGTQIAFVRTSSETEQTVYIVNADGSGAHAVYPLGLQLVPGWQPRGDDDLD